MVIWITGLSGSGKTTISKNIYTTLKSKYIHTILLDGDVIREVLNHSYGYTLEERLKGAKQIHGLCKLLEQEGMIVVCATMSLFHEIQELNRKTFSDYCEIFLDVKISELYMRDKNSLYSNAKNGLEKNVVGIDLKYESPISPELSLDNNNTSDIEKNTTSILSILETKLC